MRSAINNTRTIINYNPLPEMTLGEFVDIVMKLGKKVSWYHFEVG